MGGSSDSPSRLAKVVRIRSKAAKVKENWAGPSFDPLPAPMLRSQKICTYSNQSAHTMTMSSSATPSASRTLTIEGITLHLAQPMTMGQEWIGNREITQTTTGLLAGHR